MKPAPARSSDPADGFYLPGWKQAPPPPPAPRELPAGRRRWLLFAGHNGLGEGLGAEIAGRGGEVVALVRPGERFSRDPRGFTLDPEDADGYERLLDELAHEDRGFDAILHLWNLEAPAATDEEEAGRAFFGLQGLARALSRHALRQPLEVLVATAPVHRVTGSEAVIPGRATLLGPCLTLPQEVPGTACRVLDLSPAEPEEPEETAELLLAEILDGEAERVVAWRHGLRWVRSFEPVRLERPAPGEARLPEGGTCLITGGLGGVGLSVARALFDGLRARLVLVSRSPLPAAGGPAPDAETAERIARLQALRDAGAEVLVLTADVTDEAAMREAVAAARARFGRIDGVVHAAGVPPGGLMAARSRAEAAAVLAPKVRGTLVLERVLADDPPAFLLLCSSLSALAGAFGLADHCAANAFLDAFAQSRTGRSRPFILAVGWDTWLEVGQAAQAAQRLVGVPEGEEPAGHPLLARRRSESPEREVWSGDASAALWWVLDEHRLQGDGLLPGTAYLELLRAAAAAAGEGPVAIRRLVFLTPLRVPEGERRSLRVVLEGIGGERAARVESRPAGGGDWVRHAEAVVGTSTAAPRRLDLPALLAASSPREVAAATADAAATGPVTFGPRWQGLLRELRLGPPGEGLALHELDERFAGDLDGLPLHPALLDAATGVVQSLGTGTYLPLAYEEVVVHGPLPRRLWSRFRLQEGGTGETLAGDLSLLDEEGWERVAIRGFTLRRLDPAALPPPLAAGPADRTSDGTAAESRGGLAAIYGEGLRPAEGGEAALRLLGLGVRSPQLLATPRDLPALLRGGGAFTPERLLGVLEELRERSRVRPRPALPAAWTPPRNPVEQRLVGILEDLLRVEPVGIHDSFFDLGGDSILATRLLGTLGEAFDVQLSLRTVFEAPSAAELALAVIKAQAAGVDAAELAAALDEIRGLSPAELRALLAEEERLQTEETAP